MAYKLIVVGEREHKLSGLIENVSKIKPSHRMI